MPERLRFGSASGAGCVGVFVEPSGMSCQVTLCRSYLVDTSSHKLPLAHEGGRGEAGKVLVVWRSVCVGGPVLEEDVSIAGPKGLIGFLHELMGGNV